MNGYSHHRSAGDFVSNMLVKNITIGTTEIELKVGDSILYGRKLLVAVNDSSSLVYVSYLPTFTVGGSDCYVIYSGAIVEISLNPNPPDGVDSTRVYAKLEEGETTIKIVEVS